MFDFFSIGGPRVRPRLDFVIRHLRAVEVLEVVGIESLVVPVCLNHFNLRLMYTFSPSIQELQLVSGIPRLRILILSNRPYAQDPVIFESQQLCEEYFPKLFASCSALQHIHLALKLRLYRRWSRDPSPHRNHVFEVKEVLLPEWNISS